MFMIIEVVVVVLFVICIYHTYNQSQSRASSYKAPDAPPQPVVLEETEMQQKKEVDEKPVNNVEPPYVPEGIPVQGYAQQVNQPGYNQSYPNNADGLQQPAYSQMVP